MSFFTQLWLFIKEIFMFGIEVFIMAISREIGRRFWNRLKERGAAIGVLEPPREAAYSSSSPSKVSISHHQSSLPFLDEYRD